MTDTKKTTKGKAIGIDLGTTFSAVAVMEGGKPVIIPNSEGERTTPSVVSVLEDGERLVGRVAKNQAITNPKHTVRSIKRHMGEDHKVDLWGTEYTPQEISALILQKLKLDAENYLGQPVQDAVITVPAYFTDAQRQATKDAGRIAGLNVLRIINEPTAASLAYGLEKTNAHTILVFDFGGGTFDVSILELGDGVFEVKATNGDNHLGGDDIDNLIVDYLADDFRKQQGIDLREDATAHQRLIDAAEKAKIMARVEKQTMTAETSIKKIEKIVEPEKTTRTNEATVSYRTDYEVEVTDLALLPREFFDVNMAKVRSVSKALAKAGQPGIAGVKVTEIKVPSIRPV